MKFISTNGKLTGLALVAAAALAAGPAQAALLAGPIDITLTSPGGVTTNGGVTVNPLPPMPTVSTAVATGIVAGDGTSIGNFMLAGESITFGDATHDIQLRVGAGSDDGTVLTTGYLGSGGTHARYTFSNIVIAGELITGVAVSGSGFDVPVDLSSLVGLNVSGGILTVDLDTMVITRTGGASESFGSLTIDLLTCVVGATNCGGNGGGGGGGGNVPEPASLALMFGALAGLPAWRRQFRPTARRSI